MHRLVGDSTKKAVAASTSPLLAVNVGWSAQVVSMAVTRSRQSLNVRLRQKQLFGPTQPLTGVSPTSTDRSTQAVIVAAKISGGQWRQGTPSA
jgi:hypothetical protein